MVTRENRYMLAFKYEGSMYLLMGHGGAVAPFIDAHEECALRVVTDMYTQALMSPNGVLINDFEMRILKHEFEIGEPEAFQNSVINWLDEVQNRDGAPQLIRNFVGAAMRLCQTPVGMMMGMPLKEELIAMCYCADSKVDRIRANALSVISN